MDTGYLAKPCKYYFFQPVDCGGLGHVVVETAGQCLLPIPCLIKTGEGYQDDLGRVGADFSFAATS